MARKVKLRPLGRLVNHDPRSWDYRASVMGPIVTVQHKHYGVALNQGDLGSCTGNAMAQALNCAPYHKPRARLLKEKDAVLLYSAATRLDPYPGTYPPDDTGSSGLAVMKAAKNIGLISSYSHAFGLDHVLGALQMKPGILGIPWYEGFDSPRATGECLIDGIVRGGHEVCMTGVDATRQRVWCLNSWGRWGYRGTGRFWFSWDTLRTLLSQQGDATFAN